MFDERRLLSRKEACNYVGLGLCGGVDFCNKAGARVKIGGRVLYDKHKLDDYINKLLKSEGGDL